MAALIIRKFPDPVLRHKAEPVARVTKEIKKLIRDMMDTMHKAGGVGLAAPQVGISKRVIVIDLSETEQEGNPSNIKSGPMAFVNPEITFQEGRMEGEEGCLSFPSDVRGVVPRAAKVTVKVVNQAGKVHQMQADELLSRVFQHEIDHLNGVLFIDRMSFTQKLRLREALGELNASEKKWSMA